MPFPLLTMQSDDYNLLSSAFKLAADMKKNHKGERPKVVGWTQRGEGMIFFIHTPLKKDDFTPLPVPIPVELVAQIASEQIQLAQYPKEPDHDGMNKKGWKFETRVPRSEYGGDMFEALCMVTPVWMEYGK